MAAPSHRILRQVVEIKGGSAAEAPGLQSALRETYFRDLLPAIDDALSALAVPGQVHRIDRLEIDLGPVPGGALDGTCLARFKADFGARVAAAIAGAAPADSDLELWLHFLESGSLPWWADGADPRLASLALARLLVRPQQQWLPALRHLVAAKSGGASAPSAVLRRLARAFADEPLHALLAIALSALPGVPAGAAASVRVSGDASVRELTALTRASLALLAHVREGSDSPARLRTLWWEQLLGAVLAPGARSWEQLLPALFDRIAGLLGSDRRRLARALREQLATRPAAEPVPAALWRALGLETSDLELAQAEPHDAGAEALRVATLLLSALFVSWQQQGGGVGAELWAALAGAVPRLPPGLALRWQAPAASVGQPAIEAVATLVETAVQLGLVPAAPVQRFVVDASADATVSTVARSVIPGWPADAVAALRARLRARLGSPSPLADPRPAPALEVESGPGRRAPVDARFSDTDTLYIDNAGLVVLWPFIGSLFQRLGLVESGAFKNEAAAMRGVGLLQLLALGDPSPPEFALPLNKLLCGLAFDAVFDFGEPVTELEAEECAAMLEAAISRAPILRQMSVAGFRASFVLRRGQLSARDGHWLLRVERETHDIVLDRFPWGVGLVKLPWMPALLQVEW